MQNLESDYNQGSISKDDFLDDLEKYVMRLAKAKDKSRDVKTQLTAQLEAANEIIEKRDETILCRIATIILCLLKLVINVK